MTPTEYIDHLMPSLDGWCTTEKATCITKLIAKNKPFLFLEIGVFAGRSLFAAAVAMEAVDHGRCIGIDPWAVDASTTGFNDENRDWWAKLDHEAIYRQCETTLRKLGLGHRCALIRATSAEALPRMVSMPAFDMLHIDGNHSQDSALFDVNSYVPLVRAGGVILFDDMDWQTTKAAQKRMAELADLSNMVGNCGIYVRKPSKNP